MPDYDVIEVGAGETFEKIFSDGETWGNVIIDISAEGASYFIDTRASNFEMRNVGFRGQLDRQAAADTQFFVGGIEDPNGTGLIENFYHPGTTYPRSYETSPSGIYLFPSHAGELTLRNWYITDLPSHAAYASGPGNPSSHPAPGSQGVVKIEDSFCSDLENSGWRIGTDGSYVENCVSFRTTRGVWAYYNDVEIRNCDLGDNNVDISAGNGSWGNTGTVTVENTRYESDNEFGGAVISGSSAGTPEERIPEGCPTTPEEAASGGGGGEPTDISDAYDRHGVNTLEFETDG